LGPKEFPCGLTFVVLSRVTSLNGLGTGEEAGRNILAAAIQGMGGVVANLMEMEGA